MGIFVLQPMPWILYGCGKKRILFNFIWKGFKAGKWFLEKSTILHCSLRNFECIEYMISIKVCYVVGLWNWDMSSVFEWHTYVHLPNKSDARCFDIIFLQWRGLFMLNINYIPNLFSSTHIFCFTPQSSRYVWSRPLCWDIIVVCSVSLHSISFPLLFSRMLFCHCLLSVFLICK